MSQALNVKLDGNQLRKLLKGDAVTKPMRARTITNARITLNAPDIEVLDIVIDALVDNVISKDELKAHLQKTL